MPNSSQQSCILCGAPEAAAFAQIPDYFHCPRCDLRFLNPERRLPPAEEKARYDIHQNDETDARYIAFLSPLFTALNERIARQSVGLDFGCGPSPALANLFVKAGHQVTLYDPFFHPDESFASKQYDFISASEVAEHFYDPLKEFTRFFQLLKPGGWLGVMTHRVSAAIDFVNWYYRRDPTHVVFYSQQSLQWIAKRLGFHNCAFVSERVVLLQRP